MKWNLGSEFVGVGIAKPNKVFDSMRRLRGTPRQKSQGRLYIRFTQALEHELKDEGAVDDDLSMTVSVSYVPYTLLSEEVTG